ncbi:hypothetical protein H8356DRAFT_1298361 [Neocallimastix lanati (nom. inval.)]|nr:hypothetical protein H8356DRAFT_1298361 [Neocallimastix sp. JGI-2020a]
MEENINIEICETNRRKEQLNFKVYRCIEDKTLNKCKFFIILNDKKEILRHESLHNHLEKEFDVSISIAKYIIIDEIRKSSIPLVSQEMGFICPKYKTIKFQIIRDINKELPPTVTKFDEIPDESKYYKAV